MQKVRYDREKIPVVGDCSYIWHPHKNRGKMAVNQKGANGLIAEYKAAVTLNHLLATEGFHCLSDQSILERNLKDAIKRVGNELTESQVERALKQGVAAGEYLFDRMLNNLSELGIYELQLQKQGTEVEVSTIGNATNSGDPTDILIKITNKAFEFEVPISLKAYRGPESSLGSKSSRASLTRLFLDSESVLDEEFIEFFENDAVDFFHELDKFKVAARDFYVSPDGSKFLDAYEKRKGTRKVNNPLRRKEVGDFFINRHGYKPEHKLADLYVRMFNTGVKKKDTLGEHSESYINALRFILGNPEMLVVDVIADDAGRILDIHNSLTHPVYKAFNQILNPGMELKLTLKPNSSIIKVELVKGELVFRNLSLAMWKDGTIQYKLNTERES